jgi:hypothetical protein
MVIIEVGPFAPSAGHAGFRLTVGLLGARRGEWPRIDGIDVTAFIMASIANVGSYSWRHGK